MSTTFVSGLLARRGNTRTQRVHQSFSLHEPGNLPYFAGQPGNPKSNLDQLHRPDALGEAIFSSGMSHFSVDEGSITQPVTALPPLG
jgi:hypothetical protein